MTLPVIVLAAYLGLSLLYWLWIAYSAVRLRGGVPILAKARPPEPQHWPKLSVIVPACNEADDLEQAARTLLEEDYPHLEIVLVDDRSTDATGAIIDRLAASDPRVRAIHVTELPDGWLGKVHALDRGFRESTGEFVLFTDADVHIKPGTLRSAVAYCLHHNLDHLAGLPQLWPTSFPLSSVIATFIREFLAMTRPWAVGDPKSRAFIGIGAFNLVRRTAFEATEGFAWLRMEVADDMGVGYMMKKSGARCGVVSAVGYVGLHWYRSMGQAVRGAEKGYSTAFRCSVIRAFVVAALMLALEMAPILCLLPLAWAELRVFGYGGIAVFAAFVFSTILLGRWGRGRVLPGLCTPFVAPILAAASIRCGLLGWRRGGVLWRNKLYPSALLKKGKRIPLP